MVLLVIIIMMMIIVKIDSVSVFIEPSLCWAACCSHPLKFRRSLWDGGAGVKSTGLSRSQKLSPLCVFFSFQHALR